LALRPLVLKEHDPPSAATIWTIYQIAAKGCFGWARLRCRTKARRDGEGRGGIQDAG
jgi:hypothetical protein